MTRGLFLSSFLRTTIAMAIVMGVVPNLFLRPMEPAVKKTIERVTGRSYAQSATRDSRLATRENTGSPEVMPQLKDKRPESAAVNHETQTASREPRVASRESVR